MSAFSTSQESTGPESPPQPFRSSTAYATMPMGMIEASGPDAVRFVDNFTTAAISPLSEGNGTEGFFTDARGWVLALTTILRTESGLLILTATPAVAAALRDHLDHYHIRERLALNDVSATHVGLFVGGPTAADAVTRLCGQPPPTAPAGHATCRLAGCACRVVREEGRGADGYRLLVPAGQADALAALAEAAGAQSGDPAVLEAMRIEAGYPTPADIPPKTLPQELGRDANAISFTKGCYLGQETVARLDALGHVNRRLVALRIEADRAPAVPAAVMRQEMEIGTLTSACVSPTTGGPLGLGLVQIKPLAEGGLSVDGRPVRPLGTEHSR